MRYAYERELMSVRESLNRYPRATLGIAAGALVVAIVLVSRTGSTDIPATRPAQEYYTVDGGKTYFTAPADQVVPFARDGKEAVRAQVVRCGNQTPYVQYLVRYSSDTIRQIEIMRKDRPAGWEAEIDRLKRDGSQFAEPGSKQWIGIDSPKFGTFLNRMRCPDGSEPIGVLPNYE